MDNCLTITVPSHTQMTLQENDLRDIKEMYIGAHSDVTIVMKYSDQTDVHCKIIVGPYALVRLFIILKDISAKLHYQFELEEHARIEIKGMYELKVKQEVNITTVQHHKGIGSYSSIVLKGILYDHARADYKGTIIIDESAPQSHAEQYNKSLMLSDYARTTSIPSLEVLTDNVKCKHGAAVGQLSADHLFYLQSRGIELAQAKSLLIDAFFAEVIEKMPEELE